jgi:hypothetical protein
MWVTGTVRNSPAQVHITVAVSKPKREASVSFFVNINSTAKRMKADSRMAATHRPGLGRCALLDLLWLGLCHAERGRDTRRPPVEMAGV